MVFGTGGSGTGVCADDQISKRVGMHAREPDEDTRIADVVFFQIVGVRIVLYEHVPIGDIHPVRSPLVEKGFHEEPARMG